MSKSNPSHTPTYEANRIVALAVRRAHKHIDEYLDGPMTPSYKKRVLALLAKKYNRLNEKPGCDGSPIVEDAE